MHAKSPAACMASSRARDSRRVAVSIHHTRHGNHSISVDCSIEWSRRRPFGRSDVRETIVIDDNRALFDHLILLAHRNDDSTMDEELYDTPQQSTKMHRARHAVLLCQASTELETVSATARAHTKPIFLPQFSGSLRNSTICLLAFSEK